MIVNKKHRVLVVSGRLLMAQSLVSVLESLPGVGRVESVESLSTGLEMCRRRPPNIILLDLPAGTDAPLDRPIKIDGREIKTIIIEESREDGRGLMRVYSPGAPASLQNLADALGGEATAGGATSKIAAPAVGGRKATAAASLADSPAVPVAPQPPSLISASASSPSSERMRSSKVGL